MDIATLKRKLQQAQRLVENIKRRSFVVLCSMQGYVSWFTRKPKALRRAQAYVQTLLEAQEYASETRGVYHVASGKVYNDTADMLSDDDREAIRYMVMHREIGIAERAIATRDRHRAMKNYVEINFDAHVRVQFSNGLLSTDQLKVLRKHQLTGLMDLIFDEVTPAIVENMTRRFLAPEAVVRVSPGLVVDEQDADMDEVWYDAMDTVFVPSEDEVPVDQVDPVVRQAVEDGLNMVLQGGNPQQRQADHLSRKMNPDLRDWYQDQANRGNRAAELVLQVDQRVVQLPYPRQGMMPGRAEALALSSLRTEMIWNARDAMKEQREAAKVNLNPYNLVLQSGTNDEFKTQEDEPIQMPQAVIETGGNQQFKESAKTEAKVAVRPATQPAAKKAAKIDAPDPSAQLATLTNREYAWKTVEWTPTNEPLVEARMPTAVLQPDNPLVGLLDTHYLFRLEPVFRVQITMDQFMAGQLIVAWVPLDARVDYASQLTMYDHFMLNYENQVGTLQVPFSHLVNYHTTISTDDDLGVLYIVPYNQLRPQTDGRQTVVVSIFVSFNNPEIHGMTGLHKYPATMQRELAVSKLTRDQKVKLSQEVAKAEKKIRDSFYVEAIKQATRRAIRNVSMQIQGGSCFYAAYLTARKAENNLSRLNTIATTMGWPLRYDGKIKKLQVGVFTEKRANATKEQLADRLWLRFEIAANADSWQKGIWRMLRDDDEPKDPGVMLSVLATAYGEELEYQTKQTSSSTYHTTCRLCDEVVAAESDDVDASRAMCSVKMISLFRHELVWLEGEELGAHSMGPQSGAMGDIAAVLDQGLDILNPIMDIASLFLDNPVQPTNGVGDMGTTDQPNAACVMGVTKKDWLKPDPLLLGTASLGTLSLIERARRSMRSQTLVWKNTDPVNYILGEGRVSPLYLDSWEQLTDGVQLLTAPTPLCAISNLYHLWKGSLEMTLQVVKSAVHKGRLMVRYFPGLVDPSMISNSETVWHMDLEKESVMTVKFSYFNNVDYMFVNNAAAEPVMGMDYIGTFSVIVQSELSCPTGVTNEVEINVSIAGGPDFWLAVPRAAPLLNDNPTIWMPTEVIGATRNPYNLEPQSGAGEPELAVTQTAESSVPEAVTSKVPTFVGWKQTDKGYLRPDNFDPRVIMAAPYLIGEIPFSTLGQDVGLYFVPAVIAPVAYGTHGVRCAQTYLLDSYLFKRGGSVLKIVATLPYSACITFALVYHPASRVKPDQVVTIITNQEDPIAQALAFGRMINQRCCIWNPVIETVKAVAFVQESCVAHLTCTNTFLVEESKHTGCFVLYVKGDLKTLPESSGFSLFMQPADDFYAAREIPFGELSHGLPTGKQLAVKEKSRRARQVRLTKFKRKALDLAQVSKLDMEQQWGPFGNSGNDRLVRKATKAVDESRSVVSTVRGWMPSILGQYNETAVAVKEASQSIKTSSDMLGVQLPAFFRTAEGVASNVEGLIHWAKTVGLAVAAVVLVQSTPAWVSIPCVVLIVCYHCGLYSSTALAGLLVSFWACSNVLRRMFESKIEPGKQASAVEMQQQAPGAEKNHSGEMLKAVLGLLAAGGMTSVLVVAEMKSAKKSARGLYQAVTEGVRSVDTVGKVVNCLTTLTTGYQNYTIYGTIERAEEATWIQTHQEYVSGFVKAVDDLRLEYSASALLTDMSIRSRILNLQAVAADIRRHLVESSQNLPIIRDPLLQVERWVEALAGITTIGTMRPEPVVVFLYGKPGSGKSMLTTRLIKDLAALWGMRVEQALYSRGPTDHYDGYVGQPIMLYDDIGQNTAQNEEWIELIKYVSQNPHMLPMANLAEKGRYFTSRVVVCTSNLPNPKPNSVADPVAIRRRLHIKVEVEPKEAWTTPGEDPPQYDKQKLAQAAASGMDPFEDMSHIQLTRWNALTDDMIGDMTYAELLNTILAMLKKNQDELQRTNSSLNQAAAAKLRRISAELHVPGPRSDVEQMLQKVNSSAQAITNIATASQEEDDLAATQMEIVGQLEGWKYRVMKAHCPAATDKMVTEALTEYPQISEAVRAVSKRVGWYFAENGGVPIEVYGDFLELIMAGGPKHVSLAEQLAADMSDLAEMRAAYATAMAELNKAPVDPVAMEAYDRTHVRFGNHPPLQQQAGNLPTDELNTERLRQITCQKLCTEDLLPEVQNFALVQTSGNFVRGIPWKGMLYNLVKKPISMFVPRRMPYAYKTKVKTGYMFACEDLTSHVGIANWGGRMARMLQTNKVYAVISRREEEGLAEDLCAALVHGKSGVIAYRLKSVPKQIELFTGIIIIGAAGVKDTQDAIDSVDLEKTKGKFIVWADEMDNQMATAALADGFVNTVAIASDMASIEHVALEIEDPESAQISLMNTTGGRLDISLRAGATHLQVLEQATEEELEYVAKLTPLARQHLRQVCARIVVSKMDRVDPFCVSKVGYLAVLAGPDAAKRAERYFSATEKYTEMVEVGWKTRMKLAYERFKQQHPRVHNFMKGLLESLVAWAPILAALGALLATTGAVTWIAKKVAARKENATKEKDAAPASAEPQAGVHSSQGAENVRRNRFRVGNRTAQDGRGLVVQHGGKNTQPVMDLAYKNLYSVRVAGTTMEVNALGVMRNLFLAPAHLFHAANNDDTTLEFIKDGIVRKVQLNLQRDVVQLTNANGVTQDAVLIMVRNQLAAPATIVHHFMTDSDIHQIEGRTAALLFSKSGAERHVYQATRLSTAVELTIDKTGDVTGSGVYYSSTVFAGLCGATLVIDDDAVTKKISGIHVAGNAIKNIGYAALVTQEMISAAAVLLTDTAQPLSSGDPLLGMEQHAGDTRVKGDGTLKLLAGVTGVPTGNTKAKHKRTPEYERFYLTKYDTAVLRKDDPRTGDPPVDPLVVASKKLAGIPGVYKPEAFSVAVAHIISKAKALMNGKRLSVLSEQEAINGKLFLDGVQSVQLQPMEMDTAPGWPYVKRFPHKRNLFKNVGTQQQPHYVIDDKELRTRLDDRVAKAKVGVLSDNSLMMTKLKNELITKEKVAAAKTRIYDAMPTDFVVAVRESFGDFVGLFLKGMGRGLNHAVGCDPEVDWTRFAKYLVSKGKTGFDTDYSNYDGSIPPMAYDAIMQITDELYHEGEQARAIRHTLISEMCNSARVMDNAVFAVDHGNPSGNPLTTVINSIVNLLNHVYAWELLAPTAMKGKFDEYVSLLTFGDDAICTVKPEAAWYNRVAVAKILSEVGFKLTAANKGAEVQETTPLEDMQFLRRKFVRVSSDLWLAPISEDVIHDLFNFSTQPNDPVLAENNCLQALAFAFHHGKAKYNEVLEFSRQVSVARERETVYPEYAAMHSRWRALNGNAGTIGKSVLRVPRMRCGLEGEEAGSCQANSHV